MRWRALLLIAAVSVSQGDILHLRDGSRHYGRLVERGDERIRFRIVLADGVSSIVRDFDAAVVDRIEPTGRIDAPPSAGEVDRSATQPRPDVEQMLREAFELIDDGEPAAALRATQRAVRHASDEEIDQLDAQCRAARAVSLAELMATLRIELAADGDDDEFRLTYATELERDALGRLLEARQSRRLESRRDGRPVREWAEHPELYEELGAEARELAADASRAAALITARLDFDPRLTKDRAARVELLGQRRKLVRLAGHVMSMRGFTAPRASDPQRPDPAAEAAARLARGERPTTQPARIPQPERDAPPVPTTAPAQP
jgi:hypothetical protein